MVLVHGVANFFCSGIDLNLVRRLVDDKPNALRMSILMRDNLSRLSKLSLVTIALIEGKAIGGGAELAVACDFRVMAFDSEIGFVHTKMGITFAFGGGVLLVRKIGALRALEVLASGDRYGAERAEEINIAAKILYASTSQERWTETNQWAEQFLELNQQVVKQVKQFI